MYGEHFKFYLFPELSKKFNFRKKPLFLSHKREMDMRLVGQCIDRFAVRLLDIVNNKGEVSHWQRGAN